MLEELTAMEQHIHTLSTGVRVKMGTVSLAAITDAFKRTPQPPVPKTVNQETGREEENLEHPDYREALDQANMDRADAVMEILALFAVDLVDSLPQDDRWLKQLELLERRGRLSLKGFDLEDDVDREFLYTKYVALSLPDWMHILNSAGMNEDVVTKMIDAFAEMVGE